MISIAGSMSRIVAVSVVAMVLGLGSTASQAEHVRKTTREQLQRCDEFLATPRPPKEGGYDPAVMQASIGQIMAPPEKGLPTSEQMERERKLTDKIQDDLQADPKADWRKDYTELKDIMTKTVGPDHPMSWLDEISTASALARAKRDGEALKIYLPAYRGLYHRVGAKNYLLFPIHRELFELLVKNNRCSEALALPAPDPTILPVPKPANPKMKMQGISDLGKALEALKKSDFKTALETSRKVREEIRDALGADNMLYHFANFVYGISLFFSGDVEDGQKEIDDSAIALGALADSRGMMPLLPMLDLVLLQQQRYDELIALTMKANAGAPPESAWLLTDVLATALNIQGRYRDAENVLRTNLAPVEAGTEPIDATYAGYYALLASAIRHQGRADEALRLLDEALTKASTLPPKERAAVDAHLQAERVRVLLQLGRAREALDRSVDVVKYDDAHFGKADMIVLVNRSAFAQALLATGLVAPALDEFKKLCPLIDLDAIDAGFVDTATERRDCELGLAASYYLIDPTRTSEANFADAFMAAQQLQMSAAGRAMASAGARIAVAGSAVAPFVKDYETAIARRDAATLSLQIAVGEAGTEVERKKIANRRNAADADAKRLIAQIRSTDKAYAEYASPQPVTLTELQGGSQPLLRDDEALILLATPPSGAKGFVFVVSRSAKAWAQTKLSGEEIATAVSALREDIDPCGYGGSRSDCDSNVARPFDRTLSYRLYDALLGDAAVQAVLADPKIKTLLFVPIGALTTLPPAILVTAPPLGGRSGDGAPELLRRTKWLIQSYALAILPSVSSLRTLRIIMPLHRPNTPAATVPLFAMADPDFAGANKPAAQAKHCSDRSVSASVIKDFYYDRQARRELLASFCRLKGTEVEAEALKKALGASDDEVLMRGNARETKLAAAAGNGLLANARVVAFATHGLVAGDVGLGEPALALAAPLPGESDDGFMTASEIAQMRFNADWVVLSACNTASPDAPSAQGLSGLSRAFLFAGAHSVLVSHWRIGDDATAFLIEKVFELQHIYPEYTKAQALQAASLALLSGNDTTGSLKDFSAFPAAWAPFTLIGEPQ